MTYQLAQFNIARLIAPLGDPRLVDFVDNLDRINRLGDESPGFVWRFQDEHGVATSERPYDDDRVIVNLTVWEDIDSLRGYGYQSDHVQFVRRRREWFEPMDEAFQVLWWVSAGHLPTVKRAVERLELLRERGESADAFTFKRAISSPD